MKVTDLRRKLAAVLMAGGLLAPSGGVAADLNTNLIANADFENVDLVETGNYNGPRILDWSGQATFAYSHADTGGQGDDFANGGPFASGGQYYFTANNSDPDVQAPAVVFQDIDVSTGASSTLIATGNAAYNMSGFFSTYAADVDWGNLHLNFLNSGSSSLGTAEITPGANVSDWTQLQGSGFIPVGTETVQVSLYAGGGGANSDNDGYIDNVDFMITNEVLLPSLELRVDRGDGSLILSNKTGSSVNISGYQITSAAGGLAPTSWISIAGNYDANSGGAVDGSNNWTELTQSGSHGDLSEGELESGNGGLLGHAQSINLGNAGTWIQNPNEDLVLQYISNGISVTGLVAFEGADPFDLGDVDTDGDIDIDDWIIVRSNQHTDLSGSTLAQAYRLGDLTGDQENNHSDFAEFKAVFDGANGSGAFNAMIASIPEPSTTVLLMTSGLFTLTARRKRHPGA